MGALGVFVASNDGIGTGRDVSTGNTTSAITYAGLVSAKMKLKAQYRSKANWLFHRDAMSMILKLTDDQNRPIWQPDMRLDMPDRVLNVPVWESEYVPNTFTTGLYVGLIGDFQHYWIAESLQTEIAVASELYMATNQNGYFCRVEFDGQPVLDEAFARVKLA
jgi:HK97 family phage major capsid protein